MVMTIEKTLYVKDVAERAIRHKGEDKGKPGVSIRYVQAEIKRGNLKAEYVQPPVGVSYYIIKESDFLAWEARRAGESE